MQNKEISFCGNCIKEFDPYVYYCPKCNSNLIHYNPETFTQELAIMKWERHNKKTRLEKPASYMTVSEVLSLNKSYSMPKP